MILYSLPNLDPCLGVGVMAAIVDARVTVAVTIGNQGYDWSRGMMISVISIITLDFLKITFLYKLHLQMIYQYIFQKLHSTIQEFF